MLFIFVLVPRSLIFLLNRLCHNCCKVWERCGVPRRLFYTALQWISHRPRSQNISKERTLNPEKDSTRKRPRLHVSLEKSSKKYKPLENWAKPNLLPDVTPQLAYCFGDCIWRVCHVVKPEPREFLAILISQGEGRGRGESRFDLAH